MGEKLPPNPSCVATVAVLVIVVCACVVGGDVTGDGDVRTSDAGLDTSSAVGDGQGDYSSDVINGVRCRVRCLSLLQTSLEASGMSAVRESVSLLNCLQEPDCEACLRPCSQPFVSVNMCEEACKLPRHDAECRESCQFLKRVNSIRPGKCPAETSATGFAALCVTACESDADCEQGAWLKCCSNSCGWTCQQSLHMFDGVPEIPERPSIRERPRGVELKWNSAAANDSGPLLYIVDSRWNIGREQNEAEMTAWQQIAQTTTTSTLVADITPGHWYQFRVTAVNIYGSRGGSLPTKAFTLSKEPRKPGPPTNLTEGDTLIMGDKVAVTLHWFPPRKTDLPINRFKLYWSKKPRSGGSQSVTTPLREFRQLVPGDQHVFQIPDLEPDTTYFVQIQAICYYGDARLKSDKANIYVTTYLLPNSDTYHRGGGREGNDRRVQPTNSVRSHPTPSAPVDVSVNNPVFQDGTLKANVTWSFAHGAGSHDIDRVFVFWSPEACIADSMPDDGLSKVVSGNTQDNYFVIYGLRFDCRYLIRVQSVTNQGVPGATAHLALSTPSCQDVTVVGRQRPECPKNVPRIPDEPSDLQHSFLISSSNITARLSWGIPRHPSGTDPSPITGYRVVWGQMLQTHSVIMDKTTALTKVLPKDTRGLNIGNLLEGTTYLVRVQALSRAGAGRIASVQFTTPLLQLSPIDMPFHAADDADHRDEDNSDYGNNRQQEIFGTSTLHSARYWDVGNDGARQVSPYVNVGSGGVVSVFIAVRTERLLVVSCLSFVVVQLWRRL